MNSVMRHHWGNPQFCLRFLQAASLFAASLVVNYFAVRFATVHAGPAVPDLILGSIPMIETQFIDYYLAFYLQYATMIFVLFHPDRLIFFLKSLSFLILTRSLFINLTRLGIPEGTIPTTSFFTQGGDLFFSGHVALPFLAALVFWKNASARYFFLFCSIVMAIEVLVGHQHYAIDVFAAPFITFGIVELSKVFFKNDQ